MKSKDKSRRLSSIIENVHIVKKWIWLPYLVVNPSTKYVLNASDDKTECPVCKEDLGLVHCDICYEYKKELIDTGCGNKHQTCKELFG